MNTLAEDLLEVGDDKKLRGWVRRARNQAFVGKDEPATWFAYEETPKGKYPGDRDLVTLGRSPGDVLLTCELIASGRYYDRRGVGRWLIDNDGADSVWLVIEAKHDPDAPGLNDE
jgi:hypothetical protein